MRKIGVVSVGRSDHGIVRPVLIRLLKEGNIRVTLFEGTRDSFNKTGNLLSLDKGMRIAVNMDRKGDDCFHAALAMGCGVARFAKAFYRHSPDILLLTGDRYEMFAAAAAAVPLGIPLAHLHGGELSEGAIDDAFRHGITKMSHFHFVSAEVYRQRVIQMGEEPWRVVVTGAPSLDNIGLVHFLDRASLESRLGVSLAQGSLLVTFHPETLDVKQTKYHISQLLKALSRIHISVIFTAPNADPKGHVITSLIQRFVKKSSQARFFVGLGTELYFSLMKHASAMVGNSSSGIIEAPSFRLPVVNVGNRQRGRLRAANVIDVQYSVGALVKAIRHAVNPFFRGGLIDLKNPYGDGNAGDRITKALKSVPLSRRALIKRFFDIEKRGHR